GSVSRGSRLLAIHCRHFAAEKSPRQNRGWTQMHADTRRTARLSEQVRARIMPIDIPARETKRQQPTFALTPDPSPATTPGANQNVSRGRWELFIRVHPRFRLPPP